MRILPFIFLKSTGLWRRVSSFSKLIMIRVCFPRQVTLKRTRVARGCVFEFDASYFSLEANGLLLREHCTIRVQQNGQLVIGNNVFFNSYCSLTCLASIEIGSNCIFGEGVRIYDHDHRYGGDDLIRSQGYSKKKITIGQNCWIGSNVVILKGVTIGANSVIGAGCVLHRDVPPNSVMVNGSKPRNLNDKTEQE